MPGNTFEDFAPGQVYELGSTTVTEEEIVDFARRFDPQPFHLDAEAAKDSDFGGLIASGWHTGAMWMRLYVDSLLGGGSGQGSSGIEELRWLAPVRPGRHAERAADRARDDPVRAPPGSRHDPDSWRDGEPGRRDGDVDGFARPLRAAQPSVGFGAMSELGLFPLGIVLLPSEQIPLHIFEERYQELISDCLDLEQEFGLIFADDEDFARSGREPPSPRCSIASTTAA